MGGAHSRTTTGLTPFLPEGFFLTNDTLERELARLLERAREASRRGAEGVSIRRIGGSRDGRPLWGVEVGRGSRSVSLVAGAHADEPVGPATAFALLRALVEDPELSGWLDAFRFFICPQINPDGAERNRVWFADPPDAMTYLEHAVRETPGEDIEFGYPRAAGAFSSAEDPLVAEELPALRPENEAVAEFLRRGGPYAFHASLHGMGFSEGAWFLIGESWVERVPPLMERIAGRVEAAGWPRNHVDRRGEKGFRRIGRGFSTTPNHVAMRRFFLDAGDAATASLFHPSSMEFVQILGGDPLVMVSELPLFLVDGAERGGGPEEVGMRQERLREEMMRARAELMRGEDGRAAARARLDGLGVRAAPLREQVALQSIMIFEALDFLEGR